MNPKHPVGTLNVALRDGGGVHLNPFLKTCQQWWDSFEEKGVLIIQGNLKLLHATQENVDKMVAILMQYFCIMDEVHV